MSDEKIEMSPLREAAVQIHEIYEEFKKAGFSRKEAMELTSQMMTSFFRERH
jgi:hypothetical protein